jgi:hypothetical protein
MITALQHAHSCAQATELRSSSKTKKCLFPPEGPERERACHMGLSVASVSLVHLDIESVRQAENKRDERRLRGVVGRTALLATPSARSNSGVAPVQSTDSTQCAIRVWRCSEVFRTVPTSSSSSLAGPTLADWAGSSGGRGTRKMHDADAVFRVGRLMLRGFV